MFQEVDFGVASFTMTYERESVIDFTTPIYHGSVGMLMQLQTDKNNLFSYIRPFRKEVCWSSKVLYGDAMSQRVSLSAYFRFISFSFLNKGLVHFDYKCSCNNNCTVGNPQIWIISANGNCIFTHITCIVCVWTFDKPRWAQSLLI